MRTIHAHRRKTHVRHGFWRGEGWTRIDGVTYAIGATATTENEMDDKIKEALKGIIRSAIAGSYRIVWKH